MHSFTIETLTTSAPYKSVSRPKPLSYVENPGFPRGWVRGWLGDWVGFAEQEKARGVVGDSQRKQCRPLPSLNSPLKSARSSTTEHSLHGIHTSPEGTVFTHVSGTICHLWLGPLTSLRVNVAMAGAKRRFSPVPYATGLPTARKSTEANKRPSLGVKLRTLLGIGASPTAVASAVPTNKSIVSWGV
jgi:hypothetical protein